MGTAVARRTTANAPSTSGQEITAGPTPRSRRQASRTQKIERWLTTVARVSRCQRRRMRTALPLWKRANPSSHPVTGPRRTRRRSHDTTRPAAPPTARAKRSLVETSTSTTMAPARRARPTAAADSSRRFVPPCRARIRAATEGRPKITRVFHHPESTAAMAMGAAP